MSKVKWIIATAIILGSFGFLSGMFLDWLFGTKFICYISALIGGFFGILLHGIPDESDEPDDFLGW